MSGDDPRAGSEDGFSDALTYAWADATGQTCGIARLGIADGAASGLVLVFRGGEPVAVRADGDGAAAGRWEDVRVAGLATSGEGPWELSFDDAETPLALTFEAVGPALDLPPDAAAARAGGMQGSDRICRVEGTVGGRPFAGRGQRGRSWGAPDWERMALARTIGAWFDDDGAVSVAAIRPARARSHAEEAVSALLLTGGGAVAEVEDARLSTTYDGEDRQRAAGLELYVGAEDDHALRAAGEVVAGTSLDLGRLRLDCAFFRWRMAGRRGVGRYDVLRRLS